MKSWEDVTKEIMNYEGNITLTNNTYNLTLSNGKRINICYRPYEEEFELSVNLLLTNKQIDISGYLVDVTPEQLIQAINEKYREQQKTRLKKEAEDYLFN